MELHPISFNDHEPLLLMCAGKPDAPIIFEPTRPQGGVRRYAADDADRLRFIKRAQAMGFALVEIQNLLKLQTRRSCRATRDLAQAKLNTVTARIRELRQLRKELVVLIAGCDLNTEDARCPLMDRLVRQGAPEVM
jgi:MerR family mercuric resistance operon transcriptional regulator